jgi:hypothetical protein
LGKKRVRPAQNTERSGETLIEELKAAILEAKEMAKDIRKNFLVTGRFDKPYKKLGIKCSSCSVGTKIERNYFSSISYF